MSCGGKFLRSLRSVSIEIRVIFLRDQECFGESYIMFTGTADLVGWERSGDRLIKYVIGSNLASAGYTIHVAWNLIKFSEPMYDD